MAELPYASAEESGGGQQRDSGSKLTANQNAANGVPKTGPKHCLAGAPQCRVKVAAAEPRGGDDRAREGGEDAGERGESKSASVQGAVRDSRNIGREHGDCCRQERCGKRNSDERGAKRQQERL